MYIDNKVQKSGKEYNVYAGLVGAEKNSHSRHAPFINLKI